MQVKICGITTIEDLKVCNNYRTKFIGFINVKRSRRFLDLDSIIKLKGNMRNPKNAVLVLEPESKDEVIKKAMSSGIGNVQLYSLSAEDIAQINKINVIRAIGISKNIDDEKIREIEGFAKVCNTLLFDSESSGESGGTGKQIHLKTAQKAAKVAKAINPDIKLFLAGGINTERMNKEGKEIKKFFDYVDVNSGVEDSPGVKSESKIMEFMESLNKVNL